MNSEINQLHNSSHTRTYRILGYFCVAKFFCEFSFGRFHEIIFSQIACKLHRVAMKIQNFMIFIFATEQKTQNSQKFSDAKYLSIRYLTTNQSLQPPMPLFNNFLNQVTTYK